MHRSRPSADKLPPDVAPLVSVIIPTFNVEKYIERAIASVLAQTVQSFEIIVVDDGSTDDTVSIIGRMDDPRIRLYLNSENQGVSRARNTAIQYSRGSWLAVLDSDDWWAPDRIERLLGTARRFGATIVCDDLHFVNDGEEKPFATFLTSRVKVFGAITKELLVTPEAMIRYDFGYLKPMARREVYEADRLLYDEQASISEDFKWLVECLCAGHRLVLLPEPYYFYRRRSDSLSSPDSFLKEAKGNEIHIRLCEELIAKHGDRKDIREALRRHIRHKQINLTELIVKQSWLARRYGQAVLAVARKPGVLRPLLRNAKNKLFA